MFKIKEKKIGIFILAYNRVDHLRKVIRPLVKHTHPNDPIYIFADNSNTKSLDVEKVHSFLKKLNKKKFKIVIQKKNLGLKENWWRAYDYMYSKYDKVIRLEDDTIINKEFLRFMIDNLIKFQKNNKVMSITGYAFPTKLPKNYNYNLYFTKRSNSWGQGSWSRVWKLFKKNKENNLDILLNKKKLKILKRGGNDIVHMFVHDYLKYISSIQIWWIWNILKNDGLCINPINTLVKNVGFDGTGTHYTKKIKKSKTQNINKKNLIKLDFVIYDKKINKNFNNLFEISNKLRMIYKVLPIWLIIYLYKIINFYKSFLKY